MPRSSQPRSWPAGLAPDFAETDRPWPSSLSRRQPPDLSRVFAAIRIHRRYAGEDQFAFPKIRDRLSFTTERAYRDTTSLIVGVAAREGHHRMQASDAARWAPACIGHFHAASFPYRSVAKRPHRSEGLYDEHCLKDE